MKPLLLIGLLACSAGAVAANQKVLLETPVSVSPDVAVADSVKHDCPLEDMLARKVGPALNSVNKPPRKRKGRHDDDDEQPAAKNEPPPAVLRLQITQVAGASVDKEPGPKSITVSAELSGKGVATRRTEFTRSDTGGMLKGFKSTCSILEGSATDIGKELSRWAGDASYKIADESGPKGKAKVIENTIPAGSAGGTPAR